MSVIVYDKAVIAKIKKLFSNTVFQSRELTFKTVTDTSKEVKFPLISIYRPDGWSINTSSNTWYEEMKFINGVQQAYIDLSYQIDIYANTREDLEDLTAELVMYLLRNRGVEVDYYTADGKDFLPVKASLSYVSGPDRTSELDDTTVGRPYRYTLTYNLDNACILTIAGDSAGEEGYVPKVTQVIVQVLPEVEVQASGETRETNIILKEV